MLFADPLYFQDIIYNYSQIDASSKTNIRELVKVFEETIFPYGGGGLLGYKQVDKKEDTYLFDPAKLKKWDADDERQSNLAREKEITTFALDTVSFLIVDFENLGKLISLINYDSLIDALLGNHLDKYFETINENLGNKGWCYLVSIGVNGTDEFDGDGSYILN